MLVLENKTHFLTILVQAEALFLWCTQSIISTVNQFDLRSTVLTVWKPATGPHSSSGNYRSKCRWLLIIARYCPNIPMEYNALLVRNKVLTDRFHFCAFECGFRKTFDVNSPVLNRCQPNSFFLSGRNGHWLVTIGNHCQFSQVWQTAPTKEVKNFGYIKSIIIIGQFYLLVTEECSYLFLVILFFRLVYLSQLHGNNAWHYQEPRHYTYLQGTTRKLYTSVLSFFLDSCLYLRVNIKRTKKKLFSSRWYVQTFNVKL